MAGYKLGSKVDLFASPEFIKRRKQRIFKSAQKLMKDGLTRKTAFKIAWSRF